MRTMRLGLAALTVALGVAACDMPTDPQVDQEVDPDLFLFGGYERPAFSLTILHSNDGESELLPGPSYGGIGRFARTVSELRVSATEDCEVKCGVILVSSGDNFLAGPQFNASLDNGVPYFDAQAQDLIGYDASAIGNHEFDFGPDVLASYIESFTVHPTPFLSANLAFGGEPRLASLVAQDRIAASTIVEVEAHDDHGRGRWWRHPRRDVVRVGLIGATTPVLESISSPRNVEVVQDVAREVNREVLRLRLRGVDKIVLLSHLQGIEADLDLIPMLYGVDVVVAGGGDELLANAGDELIPGDEVFGTYPLTATDGLNREVPVITTSGQYRYVGRIEVTFDRFGRVLSSRGGPVVVQGAADPEVVSAIETPVAEAVATLQATVIGSTEVVLDGRRSSVRTTESNEGNLIADALLWQASELADAFGVPTPDVALQNGGGIRNDELFGPGEITEFDAFGMVPFANFVSVVPSLPREQFRAILEHSVAAYPSVAGQFGQWAGISFGFDPDQPAGSRIVDATLDSGEQIVAGGVLQAGPAVTMATIDFLAGGGDAYPFDGASFTRLGATYQQALSSYIRDALGGTVTAADYPEGGEGRIVQVGS